MQSHKTNHFYITTPIYYATAKPHLGSLYSTVLADIIARWNKIAGKEVKFVTGTDEHGQKIALAAAKVGMEPKAFVDQFIPFYQDTWRVYNIDYSRFMRTTDSDHGKNVQKLITKLMDQGDIYQGMYAGWYCIPCETFLTATEAGSALTKKDAAPLCPTCSRPTEWLEEKTYFFRLSAYQDKLLALYKQHPEFIIPKERANEVIKFVESGLKDLSVSRTAVSWGVPFPQNPEHTLYVWIEALCNYITAIGYGDPGQEKAFNSWWPAQVQVMGKDIVRFHGIYWPALLMAAGLDVPHHLLVHGWIKINDQKMSKSLGNVIDPMPLAHTYGADVVRYFMARYLPINQDGEFSIAALERTIEADLANDLGNLLNRLVLLAAKYNHTQVAPVSAWSQSGLDLRDAAYAMIDEVASYWSDYQIHLAYARVWHFIKQVNAYFHEQQPWKLATQDSVKFNEVLSATAHSLQVIAVLVWPVMPTKMELLLEGLGIQFKVDYAFERVTQAVWHNRFTLNNVGTLFIKPVATEPDMQKEQTTQEPKTDYISIDDLAKVALVVGTIQECSVVEKSDKLLMLKVDLGEFGLRQILSGIRAHYKPEELINKQAVFVANLQPRKLLGLESEGMLLCANDAQGKPIPVTVAVPVPNGTRLK